MAVKTNDFTIKYSVEASDAGTGTGNARLSDVAYFKALEPDDITDYAPVLSTVARNPISPDRMAKKGTVTNLESSVGYNADLTVDSFMDFSQGYFTSTWKNRVRKESQKSEVTAVTTDSYTVTAISINGATAAELAENTLVYASGFTNSGNNGIKVVNDGTTNSSTSIEVTATLTAEVDPPKAAKVEVCGFRFTVGDLVVDADGNLTSTAKDFTDLPLSVGQLIYVGGDATANQFAKQASDSNNYGFARIRLIEANKLTLDNKQFTFAADAGTGKLVDLYFGGFLRNVALDDDDFVEETYMFEATYTDYDTTTTYYEYSEGNRANQMSVSFPLTDKATASFSFVGLDTPVPVTTRITDGDGDAVIDIEPYQTDAFNTTNDIAWISLKDSTSADMGTYLTSLDLTINNNASGEAVLGYLGPKFTSFGDLNITGSASVVFTTTEAISAVRNNETVSMTFGVDNDDGALVFDAPAMYLGSAGRDLTRGETIKINLDQTMFKSDALGYVLSCSYFPYVPDTY